MKTHTQQHKFIPGTFDLAFKEIITSEECKDFTCRIISGITNINEKVLKENLVILKERLPKDYNVEKTKETDVLLSVDETIINLEMNKDYYDGLFQKNDVYQHTIISRILEKGDDYLDLNKVIQINFDDFIKYEKTISKFVLMEEETKEKEMEEEIFVKYHIALPKIEDKYYNKEKLKGFEKCLLMLKFEDMKQIEEISKGDKVLMNTKKKIEEINKELYYLGEYDKAERERKIHNTKMKGARRQGLAEGRAEGIKEGIKATAKRMLEENFNIDVIIKCTGLNEEEIKKLWFLFPFVV